MYRECGSWLWWLWWWCGWGWDIDLWSIDEDVYYWDFWDGIGSLGVEVYLMRDMLIFNGWVLVGGDFIKGEWGYWCGREWV